MISCLCFACIVHQIQESCCSILRVLWQILICFLLSLAQGITLLFVMWLFLFLTVILVRNLNCLFQLIDLWPFLDSHYKGVISSITTFRWLFNCLFASTVYSSEPITFLRSNIFICTCTFRFPLWASRLDCTCNAVQIFIEYHFTCPQQRHEYGIRIST